MKQSTTGRAFIALDLIAVATVVAILVYIVVAACVSVAERSEVEKLPRPIQQEVK